MSFPGRAAVAGREPCQSDRAEAKAIGWNPDCGMLSHGRGGVMC